MSTIDCSKQVVPPHLTVGSFPKYYDWPSSAGLRWLIFNAERNGFDRVVRRCGRRVLISTEAFNAWVEARGGRS
jgi:hypothetical protein